jgi:hypothetical protein
MMTAVLAAWVPVSRVREAWITSQRPVRASTRTPRSAGRTRTGLRATAGSRLFETAVIALERAEAAPDE